MIARLGFSFVNMIAGASVSASSEMAGFPGSNAQKIGHPQEPWKTDAGDLGEQTYVADLGEAMAPRVFSLSRANVDTIVLEANSSDEWADPPVMLTFDIARNIYNWRYQVGAYLDAGLSYQFWRLRIPDQTPLDGASSYAISGFWLGDVVFPPSHFLYDIEFKTIRPGVKVDLVTGGSRIVKTGNPCAGISAQRTARIDRIRPGYGDQLAAWSEIDRQRWEAGRYLMVLDGVDTTQAFVVDESGDLAWQRQSVLRSHSALVFTEANE